MSLIVGNHCVKPCANIHFISLSTVPQCQTALCLVPPSHLHQLQQCVSQVPQRHEDHVSRYRPNTYPYITVDLISDLFIDHICPYLSTFQSFHSLVSSRKSEALWEAALAPRVVPQGGRPLQPLKEGAWAWGRNPAQATHKAWLVLLETPILLCTPHLLRVLLYPATTTAHTPNPSHCLSLRTLSWSWEDLCLCPMYASWLMDVCLGPLRPRASAFPRQARFNAKPEAKSCGP